MTEREYIQRLRENLRQIPETETEDVVEYVREYFEEAGEEETLRALGFPESFARQISADAAAKLPPLPGIASRKQQRAETAGESGCFGSDQKETAEWNSAQARRSRATVWILVLGILSLPLSLPLAMAVILILFSVLLLVICLVFVVVVVMMAGLMSTGLCAWRAAAMMMTEPVAALYVLGAALVSSGLALLSFSALRGFVTQGVPFITEKLSGLYRTLRERRNAHA